MRRRLRYALVVGLAVAVALFAWWSFLQGESARRYGATPGIGGRFEVTSDDICFVILNVLPKAQVDIWRRHSLADSLAWSDVSATLEADGETRQLELPPGDVTPGQRICELAPRGRMTLLYLPDSYVIRADDVPARR